MTVTIYHESAHSFFTLISQQVFVKPRPEPIKILGVEDVHRCFTMAVQAVCDAPRRLFEIEEGGATVETVETPPCGASTDKHCLKLVIRLA